MVGPLAGVLVAVGTEAAKQLTAKYFPKLLNKIDPEKSQVEQAKIIKEIHDTTKAVLVELSKIDEQVKQVSDQISHAELKITENTVYENATNIDGIYAKWTDLLRKFAAETNPAKGTSDIHVFQSSLKEMAESDLNHVWTWFYSIHAFIIRPNDGLLVSKNEELLKSSGDFISHYWHMKQYLFKFYNSEIKGLLLFAMAKTIEGDEHWLAAEGTLQSTMKSYLQKQDDLFAQVVPMQTLAAAIVNTTPPNQAVQVIVRASDNKLLIGGVASPSPLPPHLASGVAGYVWSLTPVDPIDKPESSVRYRFRLHIQPTPGTTGSTGYVSIGFGGFLSASLNVVADPKLSEWYILPQRNGSCRLQFKSNLQNSFGNNFFAEQGTNNITAVPQGNVDAQYFYISKQ